MDAAGPGRLSGGSTTSPSEAVMEGVEFAIVDAVEAIHAAAVVNLFATVDVDTRRLALMLAQMTAFALGSIDDWTEHCETGEETQGCPHRADRVAICPAVLPCQYDYSHEGSYSDKECGKALKPYLLGVEGIALMLLGDRCE